MNNYELIEKIESSKLRRADPASYIRMLCQRTLDKVQDINLPVLSLQTTENLQKHLIGYENLEEKDSFTTLINIFHALKIIQKKENNPETIQTIKPIYTWIKHFEQIITEIEDPRMKPLLEIMKRKLHQQISLFNGLYRSIIDQTTSPTSEYVNLLENKQEEEKTQ